MSPTELATSIISIVSIAIALWAAYKAADLSSHQMRLGNRAVLHRMLLEIDRELLHDPDLYSMFKSNPLPESGNQPDLRKEEMYVAMYLNMFEFSFAQFKELKNLTGSEAEVSQAWDRFIVSFFDDCLPARSAWAKLKGTYYVSFAKYIDSLLADMDRIGSSKSSPKTRSSQ